MRQSQIGRHIFRQHVRKPCSIFNGRHQKQNLLKPKFYCVDLANWQPIIFDELQAATEIEILHMPREAAKVVLKKASLEKWPFLGQKAVSKPASEKIAEVRT